ncbi:telomerase protein component 1-like isoform X2 [Anneissia japonica]|uniref:telomerase protein component 1-like isoform X2 n=1 Tax=Anneissia japonica TaxID=1529436 RepID=UPI0014257AA8|nr:telomerase protein component 1-like isoform X2 [Anneissia japonica]
MFVTSWRYETWCLDLRFAVDTRVCEYSNMSYSLPTEESQIQDCVRECWKQIEEQCRDHQSNRTVLKEDSTGKDWQVVRLFVSSTFRDFHAEREVLVKKVFPELRDWCTQRHLQFIECDLRWGVPRDSTTRTTICTCLDEIQQCHDETDGAGFFLNMLGERYGWVPDEDSVPEDLTKQYGWVHGTSVTHMEIVRGAYATKNPNALFLIRDPSFLEDLPEDQNAGFVDNAEYCKRQLKELKRHLKEHFTDQVFDYTCKVDTVENGKVKMSGLEDKFAKTVLEFYKSAITRHYPEKELRNLTPDEVEMEQHQIFMEQRGAMVFGRDQEIQKMLIYAKSGCKFVDGDGSSPMVIVGDPGQGKSALMAKCVREAEHAGLNVFYHFIGCTGQSTDASNLVYRLCESLIKSENTEWNELKEKFEYSKAVILLAQLLKDFGKSDEQLLIIIDAVNQLRATEDNLKWIPTDLCFGSMRFIMSTTREGGVLDKINGMLPSAAKLHLAELDESAKIDVVQNYFARYNKKLDPEQLALIVQSEGAKNVLWLSLVCEELRIFGVFEEVTQRIKQIHPSLEGLISEIIQRMINEDETSLVEQILCFLECSQSGLKETELHFLLGDCESNEPVAMLPWAQARRTLKPFLRNSSATGGEQMLDFFHASIKKAVQQCLLSSTEKQEVHHLRLAEFFQYHSQDTMRVVSELPHQLKKVGKTKRLAEFLNTDTRAQKMGWVMIARTLQDLRCQKRFLSPGPFASVVKICTFCQNFKGGIVKRAVWPNKDICYVCGEFVSPFQRKKDSEAMLCMEHSERNYGSLEMCCVCKKPLHATPMHKPLSMYLCMICSGGINTRRCTKLVTNE